MIPMAVVLRMEGTRSFSLWLPLFPIWLLALPIVLLLLPLTLVALVLVRVNPWKATAASWNVLAGARGAPIEVTTPGNSVLMHIY